MASSCTFASPTRFPSSSNCLLSTSIHGYLLGCREVVVRLVVTELIQAGVILVVRIHSRQETRIFFALFVCNNRCLLFSYCPHHYFIVLLSSISIDPICISPSPIITLTNTTPSEGTRALFVAAVNDFVRAHVEVCCHVHFVGLIDRGRRSLPVSPLFNPHQFPAVSRSIHDHRSVVGVRAGRDAVGIRAQSTRDRGESRKPLFVCAHLRSGKHIPQNEATVTRSRNNSF